MPMKMWFVSLLCLPLIGCMSSYQPELTKPVTDHAKYEADRQSCLAEAKRRQQKAIDNNTGRTLAIGATGLVGWAAVEATADPNDDYVKCPKTMVDECLASKGYVLVPAHHSC